MNTVYYKNELTDDFEENDIEPIKIDGSYKYLKKSFIWNLISFITYRIIATPIAYLYMKFVCGMKIENRSALKHAKGQGYFLFINHTQLIGDAFMPTIINFPRKTYVVVHPNNISIPFWGNLIKLLGPLPIPGDLMAMRNFLEAMEEVINKKSSVVIYPEAHVWPYYTKIRNYDDTTFKYPIKFNVPSYAVTVTYRKRKNENKKPKVVVYIDGPFYPKEEVTLKEKRETLRNEIYNAMVERAKNNDVEYIKYVKVKEND